jgi:hypothetical protein
MVSSFFARGKSRWTYQTSNDSGVKLGDVASVGIGWGKLLLQNPDERDFVLNYKGLGAGLGFGLKIPLKFAGAKNLGGLFKDLDAATIKKLNDGIKIVNNSNDTKSDIESAANVGEIDGDSSVYKESFISKFTPDWLQPSSGEILIGSGCKGDDLQPDDFNGLCVYTNIDARVILGGSRTAMFVGMDPILGPKLIRALLGGSPGTDVYEVVSGVAATAKAAIKFGSLGLDLGLGISNLINVGSTQCSKRTFPDAPPLVEDPSGGPPPWL